MPTWEAAQRFLHDFEKLTPADQARARVAIGKFVEDLRAGRGFRPGLRVKGVRGAEGVFEMTWAPDGRATFQFGASVREGEPHIIWRRIGTHDILGDA